MQNEQTRQEQRNEPEHVTNHESFPLMNTTENEQHTHEQTHENHQHFNEKPIIFEHSIVEKEDGLSENVAGLLCYLAGIITGIIFLVIDKDRPFVRYHAFQSIFVSIFVGFIGIFIFIIDIILSIIPYIGWLIGFLLSATYIFISFLLWIFLMVQAYRGKMVTIPIAGHLARNFANK